LKTISKWQKWPKLDINRPLAAKVSDWFQEAMIKQSVYGSIQKQNL